MVEQLRGYTYKITYMSPAKYRILQNLVLNKDETLHFDEMIQYEISDLNTSSLIARRWVGLQTL